MLDKLELSLLGLRTWGSMQEDCELEWDEAKSESNSRKHGVSFSDARRIWDDPCFIEAYLTSGPEDRWAAVGRVGKSDYLTAIVTHREGKVRIISARRSTKKEVDVYGKN